MLNINNYLQRKAGSDRKTYFVKVKKNHLNTSRCQSVLMIKTTEEIT